MTLIKRNIFYEGIKNLLKSDIKQEYSSLQIQEIIRCKTDIVYFLKTYVKIINLDKGLVPFKLYDYQKEFIELTQNNKRVIALQSRQSGKTITICGYILHYMIFNDFKYIAILANKGRTARSILTKIKNMYKSLPLWIQQGVSEWNKSNIVLGNKTEIIAEATSESSIRGDSVSLLYIDECAFISENLWTPFWNSTYPTISSSKNSKIIMSSTPFGLNHFYKLYIDAKNNINGYRHFEVFWNRVPNRDNEWKEKIITEIGLQRWLQEFECQFQGSAGTLIDGSTLQNLVFINPVETRFDNKFKIFEYPQKDHNYVMFADFGEGGGGDATVFQIIDISDNIWKQVAVFRDRDLLYREVPAVMAKIGEFYNSALIVGESNNIGLGILDELNEEYEYENLFFGDIIENPKKGTISHVEYFGIKMTKKSKSYGNRYLKGYIEGHKLLINDFETIGELSTYIKIKNSYEAEQSKMDDMVTPLVLFSYFMQNKEWVEQWLDIDAYTKRKTTEEMIEDELLPLGFFHDGEDLINMEEDEDEYNEKNLCWKNI